MSNSSATTPRHVTIIMDGNGRWAKKHHKPRWAGHQAGAKALAKVIEAAVKANVEVLSVFAFSSENWSRPKEEIQQLMKLFLQALKNQVKDLVKNNIVLKIVGDLSQFPENLQAHIIKAEKQTAKNDGLTLVIAAGYGGQWDILQATKKIADQVQKGEITPENIDKDLFASHLVLSELPNPDLFIRTSGEERISNYFLWQLAYTELYFTDVLWPDFDEEAFEAALKSYAKRQRRFGGVEDDQ